jgi:DNA-binding CsgD family transcriptional regulator
MDPIKKVLAGSASTWKVILPVSLLTPILSLMLGLFLQTIFYEIAHNLPFLYRQDAHISLPLCRIAPTLQGCEPYNGILTGQQIWEVAQQVGHAGGLALNLALAGVMAWGVTLYIRKSEIFPSILLGLLTYAISMPLALVLDIPLNWHTLQGVWDFLSLLLIPPSAYWGGRLAIRNLAQKPQKQPPSFMPGQVGVRLEPGGETLSERELEVLALVASGHKNQEIAGLLHISPATVKTHLNHIYTKMGVRSRTSAVTQALGCGLLVQENISPENKGQHGRC